MAKREIKRPVTDEDIRRWEDGWTQMMITIWREKILHLGVVDTMMLYNNISDEISSSQGETTIVHKFLEYGIFVEAGVGNGYRKGNGGNLEILDPYYRKAHGLDRPRKRGPRESTKDMTTGKPRTKQYWFSKKYLSSIMVLNEVERDLYGNAYMGALSNVVDLMFNISDAVKKNLSKGEITVMSL